MKIKNLIIPSLGILTVSVTHPVLSQGQTCFYNNSGVYIALRTKKRWHSKGGPPPNGGAYYSCAGQRVGPRAMGSQRSVVFPAGKQVYLCRYWAKGASYVGTKNVARVAGSAGSSYFIYTTSGGPNILIQKVCWDSQNFNLCKKGNTPYSDFDFSTCATISNP